MKKVTLLDQEKIIYKVKFSNKATIMYFLFFILLTVIFNRIYEIKSLSILAFLFMFIFVIPAFIRLVLNLYRKMFQRIYITNQRLIIVNGYFLKFIRIFQINDITGVFYKAKKFDNVNKTSSIKITFKNNKKFIIKKVNYGIYIAQLLSSHLANNETPTENKNTKSNKKQNQKKNK